MPNLAEWMTAKEVLSWVAWRATYDDWNAEVYPRASAWPFAQPDRVASWLNEVQRFGKVEQMPRAFGESGLAVHVLTEARSMAGLPHASYPTADQIRKGAARAAEGLKAKLSDANAAHALLVSASNELRRCMARGEVTAHGRRGPVPEYDDDPMEGPREPIPPDACNAPVTIWQHGILSFATGEDVGDAWSEVWWSLLFPRSGVEALWPATTKGTQRTKAASAVVPKDKKSGAEYSENALRGWFVLRVKTWPKGTAAPSEEVDWEAAKSYFEPPVPREEFRRVRREKVPQNWRNPGPRKGE